MLSVQHAQGGAQELPHSRQSRPAPLAYASHCTPSTVSHCYCPTRMLHIVLKRAHTTFHSEGKTVVPQSNCFAAASAFVTSTGRATLPQSNPASAPSLTHVREPAKQRLSTHADHHARCRQSFPTLRVPQFRMMRQDMKAVHNCYCCGRQLWQSFVPPRNLMHHLGCLRSVSNTGECSCAIELVIHAGRVSPSRTLPQSSMKATDIPPSHTFCIRASRHYLNEHQACIGTAGVCNIARPQIRTGRGSTKAACCAESCVAAAIVGALDQANRSVQAQLGLPQGLTAPSPRALRPPPVACGRERGE